MLDLRRCLSDVPLLLCCEPCSWITSKLVEKHAVVTSEIKYRCVSNVCTTTKRSSLRAKTVGFFLIVINTNNSTCCLIFQKQTKCITFSIPRAFFFFCRFNLNVISISLIKVKKTNNQKTKLIFRAVGSLYYLIQTVIFKVLKSLYHLMEI